MHRTPTTPRRRRARLATGVIAGALLAIAAPLTASAHVEVSPNSAPAGGTTDLTFAFHHGCDDSPTTSLVIDIPEGVGNVMPVYQGGWSIERTLGADDVPTRVTFTADEPIESGVAASVAMEVLFDGDTEGTTVAFPVEQICVAGQTSWSEIPAAGADESSVDHPAPAVLIGAADTAAVGTDGEHGGMAMTDGAAPVGSTTASDDVLARSLGAGGLVAGIAALVIALLRRRVGTS